MRWLFFIAACIGCQGEKVDSATIDGGTLEASADAAGCLLPGTLLHNGDFATGLSGWVPSSVKTESIAGPCGGRGARVYESTNYGSIGQSINKKFPRGTKLRVRAYFRGLAGSVTPPAVLMRPIHLDDAGGEVWTQDASVVGSSGADWEPVEATAVLERDEEGVSIIITSRTADPDEFAVSAVSLVVE